MKVNINAAVSKIAIMFVVLVEFLRAALFSVCLQRDTGETRTEAGYRASDGTWEKSHKMCN